MKIEYLTMYKWENLPDGTKEKFIYRLEALPFELSLRNKFGCADIIMPAYLSENMYTIEMQKQYKKSIQEYRLRQKKLSELIELLKVRIDYKEKIDNEYLYELWISKIFNINWEDNPINNIDMLIDKLSLDNKINPLEINFEDKVIANEKRKVFQNIFKRNKNLK